MAVKKLSQELRAGSLSGRLGDWASLLACPEDFQQMSFVSQRPVAFSTPVYLSI